MFLLNFLRYLRGYVWFEARGVFVERFLNLVARARVAVWSGRKRGEVYTGCVAAGDYKKLRAHAKKAGVRLRVTGRKGVPFQKRRFRRRMGLVVGFALFLAFLLGMSRFVWRIELHGNEHISDLSVLEALRQLDIEPGTPRSSIDIRDSERRMILLLPELSWAALNLDGSTLRVELSESTQPPEMIDPNLPCNVVAREAGQITAMNVYDGQALVAVGDTVLPGDVIVSGITQDGRDQNRFRHARAEVFAETSQVLEVRVPLLQTEYVETGKTMRRRYLDLFGLELPVFLPIGVPSPYRVERTETPARLFGLRLPVTLLREEFLLMEERPRALTEDEAKAEAVQELANLQQARFGEAEVLDKRVSGSLTGEAFQLRAEYQLRMNIAEEREIPVLPETPAQPPESPSPESPAAGIE